jgi:hypothetical protein
VQEERPNLVVSVGEGEPSFLFIAHSDTGACMLGPCPAPPPADSDGGGTTLCSGHRPRGAVETPTIRGGRGGWHPLRPRRVRQQGRNGYTTHRQTQPSAFY